MSCSDSKNQIFYWLCIVNTPFAVRDNITDMIKAPEKIEKTLKAGFWITE